MANEKNLIPISERSPEERKAMGRKGGIASGIARRRKKRLKQALEKIYDADILNKDMHALLVEMGIEPTTGNALAFVLFQKALNGDEATMDKIMNILDDNSY